MLAPQVENQHLCKDSCTLPWSPYVHVAMIRPRMCFFYTIPLEHRDDWSCITCCFRCVTIATDGSLFSVATCWGSPRSGCLRGWWRESWSWVSEMILGQQRKLFFFVRIGEEVFEEIRQCQKHEKNTFCFMDEDLFKRIQRFYRTPPCKQKYQPTDKSYDFWLLRSMWFDQWIQFFSKWSSLLLCFRYFGVCLRIGKSKHPAEIVFW